MVKKEDECCGGQCGSGACCGAVSPPVGKVVAALVFALAILGSAYMVSQSLAMGQGTTYVTSAPPEHTIGVSSTVTTDVEPDLLSVTLRVESEDESAQASQQDNARDIASVKSALMALGVSGEDIKTSYYSVDVVRESHYICRNTTGVMPVEDVKPEYDMGYGVSYPYYYDGSDCYYEDVMVGYKTTHVLTVESENLDIGGQMVDAAVDAGATQVDYISFTLKQSTREQLTSQLLKEAAGNARADALEIASGLGASLGKAVSGSESYSYYDYYPRYEYAASDSGAAPTSISPGQVSVSATVSASFAIN